MKISTNVLLSPHHGLTVKDIHSKSAGVQEALRSALSFGDNDMSEYGYVVVGTAEIEVKFASHKSLVTNSVKAIDAEIKKIRAEMQSKVNRLEEQKANLLSITLEV